ncbi:unnamed protein product [Rotaria magnacalcarata]|nr:unnamed protein product [Rotaria magnacalcarata]CAF1302020.1 unnamed protein product [Rotaria magnacalcarata]CAF2033436.1 unnamed protein product [Rotaria magnacalcarata]CAF2095998.1 unnamed protein product [Rotaria magnacalcarata]CAF3893244.1 unnamed protein product [Rotaria magnacalcarata]
MQVEYFLFLFIVIADPVKAKDVTLCQCVISKDYFNLIKENEFSVCNQSSKNIQYLIESHMTLARNMELVAYPSKLIVAKLSRTWDLATFNILDTKLGQWLTGKMKNTYPLLKDFSYVME